MQFWANMVEQGDFYIKTYKQSLFCKLVIIGTLSEYFTEIGKSVRKRVNENNKAPTESKIYIKT